MPLKKILGVFFALIFLLFAAFQYNDPDPVVWVTIYMIAAALSVAAGYGKVSNAVLAVACIAFAVGVIYWWPEHFEGVGSSMRDTRTGTLLKNVEEGRESLGLALCSLAMLSFILLSKYKKGSNSTDIAV